MKKLFKFSLSLLGLFVALPASGQVLYKVEGNGLEAPSYLFGTHHVAPLSVAEKFGAVPLFEATTQVVGEIDMTQDQTAMALKIQPHLTAPADSTLSKLISAEDLAKMNETFKKYAPMPGLELMMLDGLKPMGVSAMVTVGMCAEAMDGFNPGEQLDMWFQTEGKGKGKTVIPLETIEEQAELLYDFTPVSVQAEALVELLKNPEKSLEQTKALSAAYMDQDLEKMEEISKSDETHPEFMEALLYRRNANWLEKLPSIFKEAPTFVAVGALHLAGPRGVVEGLRSAGYTVTPILKE